MSIYRDNVSFADPKIFDQTGWHRPEPEPVEPICRNCRFWDFVNWGCHHPDNAYGIFDVGWSVEKATPDFGCIHFEAKDEN